MQVVVTENAKQYPLDAGAMDKQRVREHVWSQLADTGAARFPFPVHGRIPNFDGADDAAERLFSLPAWRDAATIKVNPDYAQFPVRVGAIAAGKDVCVAVPRLSEKECFFHLDHTEIDDPTEAATIDGAAAHGTPVSPAAMPAIDLVVTGSVAVTPAGDRVGKGEGYSDLEYALLREVDRLDGTTPVVTTVHEHQVVEDTVETESHDVPLSFVLTPERTIAAPTDRSRPSGIDWSLLDADDVAAMPVLQSLQN